MNTPRNSNTANTGTSPTSRTQHRLAGAMLIATMVLAALGLSISAAGAQEIDPPVATPTVSAGDSAQLAALVNEYRIANGLNPLVVDPQFSAGSEAHAQLLISLNPTPPAPAGYSFWCPEASASSFYHDSAANQLASAPAGTVAYGENIAFRCSTSFATHSADIMLGWKNSPGHDTNMLNPNWTHIASVAVRWENTTIAVHRFASVPGTTPPAITSVASPAAATVSTATVDPAPAASLPATTAPASSATADATGAVPAAAPETTTTDATSATDTSATDTSATDASATADAATTSADTAAAETAATTTTAAPETASTPAAPQLAFTGTNLNLALVGLGLIVAGFGILWLPSVRRFSDQE